MCQQKCTAALQKSVEAPGPPDSAAGELKSPQDSDELVKLLLERSAELEAAKAALVRQDRELADVREKLASKDRQLTDMNVTLLASLAHLSEAQDMATKCGRAAKRGGFAPATPEHQETSTALAVASRGFRAPREHAKSAAPRVEEGTRNAVARRDRRLERGRRLAECAWIASIPTDGTWFEVDASCDFRKAKSGGGYEFDTVVVGSDQVVKMRTKEGISPTKVLDRKANSSSYGRHFYVNSGGELVVMELTLTGGYAVSVVSCSWRCVFASYDWRESTKWRG